MRTMEAKPQRLLYTREQTADVLGGISVGSVIRLEKAGRLKPIRLTGRKTGQVFHRAEDVLSLVAGAADDR